MPFSTNRKNRIRREIDRTIEKEELTDTKDVVSVTGDHAASAGEIVLADASGGPLTVTLPGTDTDETVVVKKTDSSSNAVTVATPGSETIDGDTERSITGEFVSLEIANDGSNYFIV